MSQYTGTGPAPKPNKANTTIDKVLAKLPVSGRSDKPLGNTDTGQNPQPTSINEILLLFLVGHTDTKPSDWKDHDFTVTSTALYTLIESVRPKEKALEVEEPRLYQGGGGDSSPFYCSGCQMGEMDIMENTEGEKYYCRCSYWTDPHNAYIDRSGGNWLGWKNKQAAQDYLNSLPIEENGYNQALQDYDNAIKELFDEK